MRLCSHESFVISYRSSEYKSFYESLQNAFPNNVLVSQFRAKVNSTARHSTEERGGVNRAH